MSDTEKPQEKEHGVDHACYLNGPYGFRPYIQCLCGWGQSEDTWEDLGRMFDLHLEGTL